VLVSKMKKYCATILSLIFVFLLTPRKLVLAEESTADPQAVRTKLVKMARGFLGLPYRWGGMSGRRGVDCSGLVKIIFAKLHIELPRTSLEQGRSGKNVPLQNLQNGDLVFFSSDGATPNHVGLYVGENQFIHAEQKAGHVIVTDLNQPWYVKHFFGARRILRSSSER
jgi:cell wall-associated NlpC family hydrolase